MQFNEKEREIMLRALANYLNILRANPALSALDNYTNKDSINTLWSVTRKIKDGTK
jgi:hypothetical protein